LDAGVKSRRVYWRRLPSAVGPGLDPHAPGRRGGVDGGTREGL